MLLGIATVAFITLLERKLIGLTQNRLGPSKLSIVGILQPLIDGLKLLSKQFIQLRAVQYLLLIVIPCLLIASFVRLWSWVIPWLGGLYLAKFSTLIIFVVLGVGAYAVILTGWSSTRAFSKIGSLRGILQRISYEIALIIIFIFILLLTMRFRLSATILVEFELTIMWIGIWVVISLIERNRAPFDLLEGESELIRGFNIEIGSLPFVYLFLREYGIILILSSIGEILLINRILVLTRLLVFIILIIRSCFPRIRYDSLIIIIWQILLPVRILMRILRGVKP